MNDEDLKIEAIAHMVATLGLLLLMLVTLIAAQWMEGRI